MNIGSLAGLLLAWVLGASIVAAAWPGGSAKRVDVLIVLSLGFIIGLGTSSVIFFIASLLSPRPVMIGGAVEVAATVALWLRNGSFKRSRASSAESDHNMSAAPQATHPVDRSWVEWVLAFAFVQAAVIAMVVAWRAYLAEPLGGWDAWTIWNLHARIMFRAGTSWPELLNASQLSWTHPDYPRLLSASVARGWAWGGREPASVAALVSVGFAAATIGLLVGAVAKVRGRIAALGGGLVLLATPFFVTFAPNQHADIPLGSFMLGAVVLGILAHGMPRARGWWALAGACAGFAAWTKNEGLLFAMVFAAIAGMQSWRARSWAIGASVLGGLAIALLPVIYFKLQLAPTNDLVSGPLGPRLTQLFDPARHATILSSLWRDLRGFGEWRIGPWVALAWPFALWRWRPRPGGSVGMVLAVAGLMLAGYYGVYLLTPHTLAWHLDTSLVRLLLQLWPLAIFAWCLAVPLAPGTRTSISTGAKPNAVFWGVNAVVAAISIGVLSSQRAVNELAVRRIDGAEVSASLTEGWFTIERHRRDEWAWSSGAAELQLYVNGDTTVGPVTLSFGLRGVGGQGTIVVRNKADVVWRGTVGGELVPVTIAGLKLSPGSTMLDFSTDGPRVVDGAEHGGRTLSFALYNLRLK